MLTQYMSLNVSFADRSPMWFTMVHHGSSWFIMVHHGSSICGKIFHVLSMSLSEAVWMAALENPWLWTTLSNELSRAKPWALPRAYGAEPEVLGNGDGSCRRTTPCGAAMWN